MTVRRPPHGMDDPASRHERGLALADALLDGARTLPPLPDAAHARVKRRLALAGRRRAARSPWLRPAVIVSLSLLGGAAFGVALDRVVLERGAATAPERGSASETARARSRRGPGRSGITMPPASEAPSAPTAPGAPDIPVPETPLPALPAPLPVESALPVGPGLRVPSPARKVAWRPSPEASLAPVPAERIEVAPGARSAAATPWPAPPAPAAAAPVAGLPPAPPTMAPPPYETNDHASAASPSPSTAAPVRARVPMPPAPPMAPATSAPAPSAPLPQQGRSDEASEEHLLAAAVRALRVERDARAAIVALDAYRMRYAHGRLFVEAEVLRADALATLGDRAGLLRVLDGLDLAQIPGGSLRQLQRADLRATVGRQVDAEADFTAVLVRAGESDEPLVERALWGRAQSRSRDGDPGGARADAAQYLRRFPRGPHAAAAGRLVGSTAP